MSKASPAVLILAALCLVLPFLSASCTSEQQSVHWRVTYTGVDVIAGGRPDVDFTDDVNREPMHRLDDAEARQVLGEPPASLPAQPLGLLAVALMAVALAASALRSRLWCHTAVAGLSLAAAILLWGATVLARNDATDALAAVASQLASPPPASPDLRSWEQYDQLRETFRYLYGFWLALAALATVAVANVVGLVRDPVPPQS